MHALLAVAAEAAEPSKTSYYVIGAVLVAWALIVAVVGITRPDFPGAVKGRAVMALTLALAAATMAAAVATA
jgi:hypothetical protein